MRRNSINSSQATGHSQSRKKSSPTPPTFEEKSKKSANNLQIRKAYDQAR